MDRALLSVGVVTAFMAVVCGTFGAHAMDQHWSDQARAIFETGVRYHMYHALAILVAGCLYGRGMERWVVIAGSCFLIGVVLFSGSLYLLAVTEVRWLGMITPLGGVAFLVGWATLFFVAVKRQANATDQN